jgi:hypothetical protein
MHIERIPFSAFRSLVSCTHALRDPENDGCSWFATSDRRVAGRVYQDAESNDFHISILHFVSSGWELTEGPESYGDLGSAERGLVEAMERLTGQVMTKHATTDRKSLATPP